MLKFSEANSKLKKLALRTTLKKYHQNSHKNIFSLDLLSGHFCPYAKNCLSKVVITDDKRKIQDGKHMEFRCFSASQEALFGHVYEKRKNNSELLMSCTSKQEMVDKIEESLPSKFGIMRMHVSGDFFNQTYFDAWLDIAKNRPQQLFYGYTKSLPFWVNRIEDIPNNLRLTASRGGYKDNLIDEYNLPEARVVLSKREAEVLNLIIDHDDFHAANQRGKSFSLLIHGVQKKGSLAAKASYLLSRQ